MIGRVVKRVLHRVVRALVLSRGLAAVFALLVVAGIGFGIYQVYGLVGGGQLAFPHVGTQAVSSNAAEEFLRGNQTYNAQLVWDSLSDDSRKRFEGAGGAQALQAQLNSARDHGVKLEKITFVGKQDLPDGTSMQFYLVGSRGPQSSSQLDYVPYVFTIDQAGKIAKVQ